jgi:preflagellin peptidase FlaK
MISTQLVLDSIRLIVGVVILSYASYTDLKIRKASNTLWLTMAVIGGLILVIEYVTIGGFEDKISYLIFIPIMIVIMYVFFQLRLLFGGADAKAMMALAILTPFTPEILSFPLFASILPFSWVIFSNAIILFLFIPLGLFIYNLTKKQHSFPHCFLGYKMNIEKARTTFVWPLEHIVDGKRKLSYVPSSVDPKDQFDEFEKMGITELWVTPKIPFMIPLLAGFITAFFLGDLLFFIASLFTGL